MMMWKKRWKREYSSALPSPPVPSSLLCSIPFYSFTVWLHHWLLLLLLISALSIQPNSSLEMNGNTQRIIWSTKNPLFANPVNHTGGGIAYHPARLVMMIGNKSSVEFRCAENEPMVISLVSEMAMMECQLDSSSKTLLVCDGWTKKALVLLLMLNPSTTNEVEMPMRNGDDANDEGMMALLRGTNFYFISTSNGTTSGLWNTRGGLCSGSNLRVQLELNDAEGSVEEKKNGRPSPRGDVEMRLEYSIEEGPTRELRRLNQRERDDDGGGAEGQQQQSGTRKTNQLADVLKIKPEYLDFVRDHAVRGGTGEIRFPPTLDGEKGIGENKGHEKLPRFVPDNALDLYQTNVAPSSVLVRGMTQKYDNRGIKENSNTWKTNLGIEENHSTKSTENEMQAQPWSNSDGTRKLFMMEMILWGFPFMFYLFFIF